MVREAIGDLNTIFLRPSFASIIIIISKANLLIQDIFRNNIPHTINRLKNKNIITTIHLGGIFTDFIFPGQKRAFII